MKRLRKRERRLFAKRRAKDTVTALVFLAPSLVAYLSFFGLPILIMIAFCFSSYNLLSPPHFVGLNNFAKFFRDPESLTVFKNTLKFVAVLVPAHVVIGLLLALGVSRRISQALQYLYRSVIYFPVVVTTASVAILWTYLYSYDFGAINWMLGVLGIPKAPWLSSADWVIPTVTIFSLWKFVGNSFIFYFIGLQNVPQSYMEAAEIDGADKLRTFFYVTLPMISPTVFFVLVYNCLNAIQIFDEPYFLTKGGPGDASLTVALHLYRKAFQSYDVGYASLYAVGLFIAAFVLTILQFNLQRRWVNYDYG